MCQRQRCRLGEIHADEQRADQAGRIGHGDGVNVGAAHIRGGKRLLGKAVDRFDVLARGDFGHDAAVEPVQRHLRGNLVCQHLAAVPHERNGGLVAGRFNGQDQHGTAPF